jgi:hypothetical protein
MLRRGIDEIEVEQAIDNAETTYPSRERDDRTVILGRTEKGRRLKVVVETASPHMVVTVADRDVED